MPPQEDSGVSWSEARFHVLKGISGLEKEATLHREHLQQIQIVITKLVEHEDSCAADREKLFTRIETAENERENLKLELSKLNGKWHIVKVIGAILVILLTSGGLIQLFWQNVLKR